MAEFSAGARFLQGTKRFSFSVSTPARVWAFLRLRMTSAQVLPDRVFAPAASGIDSGMTLSAGEVAGATKDSGASELFVEVLVQPHPVFERAGSDVLVSHHLDMVDAALGIEITCVLLTYFTLAKSFAASSRSFGHDSSVSHHLDMVDAALGTEITCVSGLHIWKYFRCLQNFQ